MADPISRFPGQLNLPLSAGGKVFSVSELNTAIQSHLASEFFNIWVAGEVSSCRPAASGHYYFTLKDGNAQVRSVFFKGAARLSKVRPTDGLAVLARGRLEVYEARGEYQLIVEFLELRGFGALQVAFERLKTKLEAEGLFDSKRKRPLPAHPTRIAFVTSPAGAVLRDMLQILSRRFPGLHIRLFPTLVQGEGSAEQVCRGIEYFSSKPWADVLIVARGGGSLEDLWSFNEESVARAIAGSKVPIISAIGHETDFTIADFVADYRAPTPSAAAEIVIRTRESVLEQLEACRSRAKQFMRYQILMASRELGRRGGDRPLRLIHRALSHRAQRLDDLDRRLRSLPDRATQARRNSLTELVRRLGDSNVQLRLARSRHKHHNLSEGLIRAYSDNVSKYRTRLERANAQLAHLSPLAVLGRGYALVRTQDGRILRDVSDTAPGDQLMFRLSRGEADAVVTNVRKADNSGNLQ